MDTSNLQSILNESRFYTDEIENHLIESGGEITKELEALIDYKEYTVNELESNVDMSALAIERLDLLNEYYQQQIEGLNRILEGLDRVKSRLKFNLEQALITNNLTQLSGELKTISIKKNPPKVDIWKEDLVPEDYKKIVVTTGINTMQISDDLKAGKEIPGCRLIQGNQIKIGQAKPKIGSKK